jgi:hypothetical protein
MINITKLLLAGAVALALWNVGHAQNVASAQTSTAFAADGPALERLPTPEQEPLPGSSSSAAGTDDGQGILQSLPQPPALPASLLAPTPPASAGFTGLSFPYFTCDRLLDSPVRPPGWFVGAEADVLKPFLITQLIVQDPTDRAAGTFYQTNLPSAPLNWTVSPRVFLGYRLPSGFGELSVAYRHLGSSGSTVAPILDGPTNLGSRLRFDTMDFDYSNSEFTSRPYWDMKWTAGLRLLSLSYDSQAQQPSAQAAAGSGILQERVFNNTWGIGPHVGVELARHWRRDPRWSLTLRTDAASLFTFMNDGYQSTTVSPAFAPLYPNTQNSGHQETPILYVQAGIAWQPSPDSATRFFLGYQYEHMWALNFVPPTGNNPPSTGQVVTEGIVLRATFRY